MSKPKKILIAPLNWGLGHATRCVPLITAFLEQGAEVHLASDGAAFRLLQAEFPELKIHELPAYNIRYPLQNMMLSMALQLPKILRGCIAEHFWLKSFLKNNDFDLIISDNRYGFYNQQVRSIFMTHQVHILIPSIFFKNLVNIINRYFIKKFDELWIPDFDGEPNLAGILSHSNFPKKLTIKYLGALSRMRFTIKNKKYRAIIVLSGPEPQRTIFENVILKQLEEIEPTEQNKFCIVRGVTHSDNILLKNNFKNIEIHNYLTTNILNKKILESELLISRSGYSTIMDLVLLQSKAVLVPTPGQTEQEYLANTLFEKGYFYTETQNNFNLKHALTERVRFSGFPKEILIKKQSFNEIIRELLKF